MNTKWEKHRIGKLYGDTVFIELPPRLSAKQHNERINRAAFFLERAFRDSDFIENLIDLVKEREEYNE